MAWLPKGKGTQRTWRATAAAKKKRSSCMGLAPSRAGFGTHPTSL